MSDTLQLVIVGVVVALAITVAVRNFWRVMHRRGGCSCCDKAGECPLKGTAGRHDCDCGGKPKGRRDGCCH